MLVCLSLFLSLSIYIMCVYMYRYLYIHKQVHIVLCSNSSYSVGVCLRCIHNSWAHSFPSRCPSSNPGASRFLDSGAVLQCCSGQCYDLLQALVGCCEEHARGS